MALSCSARKVLHLSSSNLFILLSKLPAQRSPAPVLPCGLINYSSYTATSPASGSRQSSYNRLSGYCESTVQIHLCRNSSYIKWKEYCVSAVLPTIIQQRRYARVSGAPQQFQQRVSMQLYLGSPGMIFEPYKPPPPPLPFWRRWFTKEGWKQRKEWWLGEMKTAYAIAKLRKKGYNKGKFYNETVELYRQINAALAQGDRTSLRQLVTDKMFSVLKSEIKQREGVWSCVHWEAVGPIKKIQTLQGRLAAADKKNLDNAFIQLTLRILSTQKFAAYDKHDKLVAGDPNNEVLVEEIWVLETALGQPNGKWRLCARI
eukprot:c19716_g1_i1 orf=239-1186(+)